MGSRILELVKMTIKAVAAKYRALSAKRSTFSTFTSNAPPFTSNCPALFIQSGDLTLECGTFTSGANTLTLELRAHCRHRTLHLLPGQILPEQIVLILVARPWPGVSVGGRHESAIGFNGNEETERSLIALKNVAHGCFCALCYPRLLRRGKMRQRLEAKEGNDGCF